MSEKVATARQIVGLLVKHGIHAGDSVQNAIVVEWAVEIGLDQSDFFDALVAAGDLNWIEDGARPGTIALTKLGFDDGYQP